MLNLPFGCCVCFVSVQIGAKFWEVSFPLTHNFRIFHVLLFTVRWNEIKFGQCPGAYWLGKRIFEPTRQCVEVAV